MVHLKEDHRDEVQEYLNMIDDEAGVVTFVLYGVMMTDDGSEKFRHQ